MTKRQLQVACFGEILWDVLPTKSLPGGAPMNVAYHLQKLGNNSSIITRVGDDNRGAELLRLFSASGLAADHVQTDTEHATGVVLVSEGEHHEMSYEIVQPVAWDFISFTDEMNDIVDAADCFVFGSLSSRNETTRNTLYRLLESARQKVFDINLRPPHFTKDNLEYLLHHTDILKMNEAELRLISDWYNAVDTLEDRMKLILQRFNIPLIIVTLGADGAIVNYHGEIYRHGGYKVEVADTIGSGDSFLAGFLHKLSGGSNMQEALEFGCAVGAFVAGKPGGCPEYEVAEIERLVESQPA